MSSVGDESVYVSLESERREIMNEGKEGMEGIGGGSGSGIANVHLEIELNFRLHIGENDSWLELRRKNNEQLHK